MAMLLEGRHLQFFVHKKLDPSIYVSTLERWRHIALPLTAHAVCVSLCECTGGQTRHVHPMLG